MKFILSALLAAATSTTMTTAFSTKKAVIIKLYNHKGLSLPDQCESALVTGFLVAFNVVGSKLDHPFAAMNLKVKEEYFEYNDDTLASASTAWIEATFDASCDSCSYNDDEPPVMFFRDAQAYLSASAAHQRIEREMLHQLKAGQMCSAFDDLEDLKLIYNPDRPALAAPSNNIDDGDNDGEPIMFQQAVAVSMNNVNKALVDHSCKDTFDDVLFQSIKSVYANDSARYLQAVSTDYSNFFPAKDTLVVVANNKKEKTNPGLRKNKTPLVQLANGQLSAFMDLQLPTNIDFTSMIHFINTKQSFSLANRHYGLEKIVEENLKSSACAAFSAVSDVEIEFRGKHQKVSRADGDLDAEKVVELKQPIVTTLEGVDMTIPPSTACFAIFEKAMVTSFNRAHLNDDFSVSSNNLHSTDMAMPEDRRRALEGEQGCLEGNLIARWSLRTYSFGRCNFCPAGNDSFPPVALGYESHASYEKELLKELQESECPALKSITGVSIQYVDSFSSPTTLAKVE